ncbi:hypothetical protein FQZ97_759360 [compost metagenome]
MRQNRVGEGLVRRSRNAAALHERLGKRLGTFQLCGGLGGTEDGQAVRTELVNHTRRQRRLGAHHGERHLLRLCPFAQRNLVGDVEVDEARVARRTGVAGGHEDLAHALVALEFPGQRVFAATAANDEDFHS